MLRHTASYLTLGELLEVVQSAVPDVRVATIGIAIGVLPERLIRPSARNGAHRARVPSQDERTLGERFAVARAGVPPVSGGIDHRIPAGAALVGVDEIGNPRHHLRGAKSVACGAIGVVLDVQHTGEGDAVI